MLRNDEKLRDIRSRCSRAKEELSANLHARLRWMMFVQRQLTDVDSRLVLHNENLRRLRRHFDLLRQLHLAPSIYLRSMVEIVRRRHFAVKFLEWAECLSGSEIIFISFKFDCLIVGILIKDIHKRCIKTRCPSGRISANRVKGIF